MNDTATFVLEDSVIHSKEDWLENLMIRRIAAGYWRVGERLPAERTLAGELSVCRNTLRGALRRLKARGLIDARQGSGYYLKSMALLTSAHVDPAEESYERIMDRLEAAYHFLPGVVSIAAGQMSDARLYELEECTVNISRAIFDKDIKDIKHQARMFFQIIAAGTGNQIMEEMVSSFCASSCLMFPGFFSFVESQQQKLFADYVLIFNALKKRSISEAVCCVRQKVINTCLAFSELKGIALPESIQAAQRSEQYPNGD
jgi:DNA-binding FadR family transcriptional regulator